MRQEIVAIHRHLVATAGQAHSTHYIGLYVGKLSAITCKPPRIVWPDRHSRRKPVAIVASHLLKPTDERLRDLHNIGRVGRGTDAVEERVKLLIELAQPRPQPLVAHSIREYMTAKRIEIYLSSPRLLLPDLKRHVDVLNQKGGTHIRDVWNKSQPLARKTGALRPHGIRDGLRRLRRAGGSLVK